ncbi:MAG TPA: ankyrin repeat domain-containing protein [Terriglobales bacterium]|nr:ankyrin repeat domain-containing protein [Terriglobales bacterium]
MADASEVIQAVQTGDTEKLRTLLTENPALAASRDASGVSALMHAVYRRQTECVGLLREAGLTLDIFEAAALGDMQAVSSLIERDGSLVKAYSADGFTALHFAAYFSQPAAAKFLLEHGTDSAAVAQNPTQAMPLHSAVSSGNVEAVRGLLGRGAPVNARQQHGWTPLHAAAQNGNLEILELLLENGAHAEIKNDEGVTALDLARKHQRSDVVNRLETKETQGSSTRFARSG